MRTAVAYILTVVAVTSTLTGCGGERGWTVNGQIEGASGETMILEASAGGIWYAIDSVKLDATGRFKMTEQPVGYPDIYRLRLGNRTLYFPIDSIETVTVLSKADAFDTEYTLEGTAAAEQVMAVDRRLRAAILGSGVSAVSRDTMLKRELGGMILGDQTGIVSYYIINKKIGGIPLFDPANKGDLRIIGAVANAFNEFRPDDPRTAWLKELYLGNRQTSDAAGRTDTIHAAEVSFFDISLYDESGHVRNLRDVAAHGKPVVLNFTVYSAEGSPAFNRQLHSVYSKYRDRGLEIYQVALDEDEFAWRNAARNLPWITVYNPPLGDSRCVLDYNVTDIPATFILNGQGDIVERVDDPARLDAAVGRHI